MEDQKKQLNRIEDTIRLLFEMQIALMEEIARTRFTKNVDEWSKDVKEQFKKIQKS